MSAITDLTRATRAIAENTPAGQYLVARGCRIPPADCAYGWHPAVSLFGQSGIALVGEITKADNPGQATGAHVTWIEPDGAGWRRRERRYLGTKAGGVVRLWPDEAITTGLAIAEGVEAALALATVFRPVWACLDAGNLAQFPVLDGVEALTIMAAHNESAMGQHAALQCADRWLRAGREVRVILPAMAGADAADLVTQAMQ